MQFNGGYIYPLNHFLHFLNFLLRNNFGFTEKLQREYREFLYTSHPISPHYEHFICIMYLSRLRNQHWYIATNKISYLICISLVFPSRSSFFYLFICFFVYLFIYLWLCWVFVSVRGLSLVAASRGHSSSRCAGLSLSWPLLLWSIGSRRAGSAIVAHGPSRSAACGIFPDQGSNPCPLHWQANSQPLRHQGSPKVLFLFEDPIQSITLHLDIMSSQFPLVCDFF